MKKFISVIAAITMLFTVLSVGSFAATEVVQNFESLTIGEVTVSDVTGLGVDNNGANTSFSVVENLYGITGKALKVTQTGNVNSVCGFSAGVTMSSNVNMSEKWGRHCSFYVPDISEDITIGLYVTLGGTQVYYADSGANVKKGWNIVKLYSDGTYMRFYVNESTALAKAAITSYASGEQTMAFRFRQVNANAGYNGWYLIDNFTAPATTTGYMDGTGLTFASATEYSLNALAETVNSDTLKAVKVAGDGSTTVLAGTDKLLKATHIFETAEVGSYGLYPINFSDSVISGVEPYMSVKDFKTELGNVSVKTQAGIEAYDNMLVNEKMSVTLENGTVCTIKADKNTAFEPTSDATKPDGAAVINYDNTKTSLNGVWELSNVTRSGGVGTGVFKSVQNGVNGYKFSYNGTNNGELNIRATTAAMDTTKMTAGDVTIYEMNLKPSVIGYYNTNFRWYNGSTMSTDEAVVSDTEATPGITFNTDGKIYLGGFRGSETSTDGMTYLCDYSANTSYEIKLVMKTPVNTDTSFTVYGVYINGKLYAANTVLPFRTDNYKVSVTSMAEVDYMFKPASTGTQYDVYLWGVKCYTADSFSTEKTDISALTYDADTNKFVRTIHYYDAVPDDLMMIAATYEDDKKLRNASIATFENGTYTATVDADAGTAKVFMLNRTTLAPYFDAASVSNGIVTDTVVSNFIR